MPPSGDEVWLHVEGMMCQNSCGTTVHNALQAVSGVREVRVSHPSATAQVKLLEEVAKVGSSAVKEGVVQELVEAVESVGFEACLLKGTEPSHQLTVHGMMCQKNCGSTVQKALMMVDGVCLAEVSFENKMAKVWGTQATVNDLIEAVEDVGFEAVLYRNSSENNDDISQEDAEEAPDAVFSFLKSINPLTDPIKVTNLLLQVDGVMTVDVESDLNPQRVKVWGFLDSDNVIDVLTTAGYAVKKANATVPGFNQSPLSSSTASLTTADSFISTVSDEYRENKNCYVVPLLVGGMSCANCSKGIENRLKKMSGILDVRVALLSGKVEVHYDNTVITDCDIMTRAITDMGYTAQLNGTPYAAGSSESRKKKVLSLGISGMSCASCATKIEDMISNLPGVVSAKVSCQTESARIEIDDSFVGGIGPRQIMTRIDDMGYKSRHVSNDTDDDNANNNSDIQEWWRLLMVSLLLGGPVVILHFSMIFSPMVMDVFNVPVLCGGGVLGGQVMMVILNAPLQFIVGYRFYRGAYLSALHGSFGMDALVVTGTTIAFTYSCIQLTASCITSTPTMHVFFETSGMLLLFVTMGKYFEAYAKGTTISAMTSLLKLQPRQAVLVTKGAERYVNHDDDSHKSDLLHDEDQEDTESIDIDLIQRGDIVKIYPGSRLPTDGIIVSGSSYIDESLITGESMPVLRETGSNVYGSTVNQKGLLYVQVTSVGSDSALAQIVQLVEAAQMDKAPIQAYADVIAGIFTPTVLCLAICTFSVWFFLSKTDRIPEAWYMEAGYGKDPLLFSLLFCISVVVISCPCALGLATPTAIMVGTSVGASNGILIKGGPPFEVAHRIDSIIFDKTGTLTKGKPAVTDEIDLLRENTTSNPINNGPLSHSEHPHNQVIRLAAIAEVGSEHPLGESIVLAAKERSIRLPDTSHAEFSLHPGGVSCTFPDGTCIRVGNRGMMENYGIALGSIVETAMWDLEVQGKTAVCVSYNSVVVGILGIADVVKPEAYSAIVSLKRMGVDVWMVTGDNQTTAEAIGDELGIETNRVVAGAFPGDKVKQVELLQKQGRFVAMVGDGINDSPALARANLGIAVGAGTHIAIEAADMVIVRNNLLDVIVALDLAKVVFRRIKVNLRWALLYNVLAIPIAAGAFFPWFHTILPPQYAGLCMALSSISVVASSLMLKFYRRPKHCKINDDSNMTIHDNAAQLPTRKEFLSHFSTSKKTPEKVVSSVISRARGRLVNLKKELTRKVSGSSDERGEYSPLPVGGGVDNDIHTVDVEMGDVGRLSGLPGGGLPPSLEWDSE